MWRQHAIWLTAGLILSLCLIGCGKKGPAPVAVKGQVQYADKKPVTNMVLTFHPLDDTNKNNSPLCLVEKEGQFQVNMLPGRYKVTLANIPLGSGNGPAGGPDVGPGKGPAGVAGGNALKRYQDREQSPWEIVVPETGKEDLVLTVK
jgi:hypothetical protein